MKNRALFSCPEGIVKKVVHKPLVGPNDFFVRVSFSGFSFGTESVRIKNSSIQNKLFNKLFFSKVLKKLKSTNIEEIKEAYRKFLNYHQSLGYSVVGVVEAKGSAVLRDIHVGDIVVCGGDYANHSDYVSVPQGMCFKVNIEKPQALYSLAFITAIPVHSVNLLNIESSQNVLVYGGGLMGMLAATYIKAKNANVYIEDKNKNCIALKIHPDSVVDKNIKWDAILISSSNADGINSFLVNANKGVKVNILGEVDLGAIDKGLIEEKYGSITFCNSFGYGRRIYQQEIKGCYQGLNFDYTIKKNIEDSLVLIEGFLNSPEINNNLNITTIDNVQINRSMINIISFDADRSKEC